MKLPEITAIVDKIEKVEAKSKGFNQVVVLHQPPAKDEFDRITAKEQNYRCEIYSNDENDSRFIKDRAKWLRHKVKVTAYLNGSRWWSDQFGDQYLNRISIQKIELI